MRTMIVIVLSILLGLSSTFVDASTHRHEKVTYKKFKHKKHIKRIKNKKHIRDIKHNRLEMSSYKVRDILESLDYEKLKDNIYKDSYIHATNTFLADQDYRDLRAVCTVESKENPLIVNKDTKAKGLCQFMPTTWAYLVSNFSDIHINDWKDPSKNIYVAAYYLSDIKERNWKDIPKKDDAWKLTLASYNAGEGNISKARRLCNNALTYDKVIQCLPRVTGNNANETISYVEDVLKVASII